MCNSVQTFPCLEEGYLISLPTERKYQYVYESSGKQEYKEYKQQKI